MSLGGRGRRRADLRHDRQRQLLPVLGTRPRARPAAHRRDDDDAPGSIRSIVISSRAVGAAVRLGAGRRRPGGPAQRPPVHDRRRRAARLPGDDASSRPSVGADLSMLRRRRRDVGAGMLTERAGRLAGHGRTAEAPASRSRRRKAELTSIAAALEREYPDAYATRARRSPARRRSRPHRLRRAFIGLLMAIVGARAADRLRQHRRA